MEYYTLKLAGLIRKLPLNHVGRQTRLANFSILGDVELVDKLADTLTLKLKNLMFDYLVAPEVKVTPLVHGIAKRLGHKKFIVCRKSVKGYMVNPTIIKPLPHFPKHVKQIVINESDRLLITGKKVIVVDDVVSTGVTMRLMKKLMEKVGTEVVLCVSIFKQGSTQFEKLENYFYLANLPIFASAS